MPFMVVLIFWLTMIFVSFGLFAQPSVTVAGLLVAFAPSAAGAIYLVLELGQPFAGLMQISSAPLRQALSPLSLWPSTRGGSATWLAWRTAGRSAS